MSTDSRYSIIKEVDMVEVLRHFMIMETSREKYKNMQDKMIRWLKFSDKRFIRKVRKFAKSRNDTNPVLVWTIGVREDKHYQKVSRWVLAKNIQLSDLYTCGIKPEMKGNLDSVNGNMEQFVKDGYAGEYTEFQRDSVPSEGEA